MSLTEQQRNDFDEKGFIILENFLTNHELARLLASIDEVAARIQTAKRLGPDEPFAVTNLVAQHEAFLDLIDHPRMLPLVVDAFGWNIQLRSSHLDYRPPYPKGVEAGELGTGKGADHYATDKYNALVWHADRAGDYWFEGASLDGRHAFNEVKVGYYLSDLTEHNSGALCLVPGSYKRRPQELRDIDYRVEPSEVFELNVPPGTALLWRTACWHCVTPNLSNKIRKVIYIGYGFRWLRPVDYVQQDAELIAQCSPIRRQLLGALSDVGTAVGEDSWAPNSRYWLVKPEDVPLQAWAEERDPELINRVRLPTGFERRRAKT